MVTSPSWYPGCSKPLPVSLYFFQVVKGLSVGSPLAQQGKKLRGSKGNFHIALGYAKVSGVQAFRGGALSEGPGLCL